MSPANIDRAGNVEDFAAKSAAALEWRIHLLLVDLFPPGRHDLHEMHDQIAQRVLRDGEPYDLPAGAPLTLALCCRSAER